MNTQQSKQTGHINTLSFDIDEPAKFNCTDLHFNQLTVFCGTNGSGKTFVLVSSWACSIVAQSIVLIKSITKEQLIATAQQTFDKSFSNQNINGLMTIVFESGASITIAFNKGKVEDVIYTGFEEINTPTPVQFMSSHMRTFDAISLYLKSRATIKRLATGITNEQLLEEMSNNYKLYDVCYIESLLIKMPKKVDEKLSETLKQFDVTEEITEFGYDEQQCDFYALVEGNKKYLTTYGKGHQSIFNMLLGSS